MCAWTITGVGPLDTSAHPVFDPGFEHHMMQGEPKDGSHRGLHSLNRILGDDYKIEQGDKVVDDQCPQIYSAKVSLVNNTAEVQAYHRPRKYGDKKLSSFFPDSMTFKDIEKAVRLAFQNYQGSMQGRIPVMPKHQPQGLSGPPKVSHQQAKADSIAAFQSKLRKLKVSDLGTKWAGKVRIANGDGAWVIWIGSPEKGSDTSKLLGACPAIRGKFF